MSADDQEQRIEQETRSMQRDEQAMEERLEHLEGDIDEAKAAARRRSEDLDDPEIAGDWEGKARTDDDPSGAARPDDDEDDA
jgi:hypothetical protein